ncbi:MFS transporter (plasmid) [Halorarum halophilum]|uniref:MFS transporter n=1 Tax=Halorarum halophilum TaxID=2743090 RepID=A0A7D5H3T9_9EURY|nr:MFS transporter [Halobaculum halophilum]QLG29913.1 MFS transporter [Halobaculum halophilum]
MVALGTRLVIPTLLPQITAEFDISNTTAGAAVTIMWLTYAGMQFPAGVLVDRAGERRILLASMGIAAVGVALFAVAPTLTAFFVACAAFGLGTGLFAPPRVTIISRTFPTKDGTVMGITFAAGNVGAAVLPFVAGILAVRFGWRSGVSFVLPMFLLVCYAIWRTVPHASAASTAAIGLSPRQTASRLARILRDRTIALLSLASALMAFTYQGFTAFFPLYLVSIKGLDPPTAALLFGAFFATGAVVQPFAGYLSDSFGERGLLVALTTVHVLALTALPFVNTVEWLAVLVIVLGTRAGAGPVNNAFLVGSLPDDIQGAGYGLLRSIIMAVSATGSVVVGAFADADYFDAAFVFLAVVIVVATGCYVLLPADSQGTRRPS